MADFYRFTDDEVAEWATKPDNSIWPTPEWNAYCLASEVSELRAEIVRLRALWGAERSEVERLRTTGEGLAIVALGVRPWITPLAAMVERERIDEALAAWNEARRER